MSLFRRKCSLAELAAFCVALIFSEEVLAESEKGLRLCNPESPNRLSWELIVFRFFWARVGILANLHDFRPALDVLHLQFFEGIREANASVTRDDLASLEEFVHGRITEYERLFNETVGAGERLIKVGFQFGRFIGLGSESQVSAIPYVAPHASVYKTVTDFLNSVRVVVR